MKSKKLKFYQRIIQEINAMQTHKFYALLLFLVFCITLIFLPSIGEFIVMVSK